MRNVSKASSGLHVPVSSVCADVEVFPAHLFRGLNHLLLLFPHHLFLLSFSIGKAFVPKQKPIETRKEEVTTLDPELEEALSSATDTELCDLAGKNGYISLRKL